MGGKTLFEVAVTPENPGKDELFFPVDTFSEGPIGALRKAARILGRRPSELSGVIRRIGWCGGWRVFRGGIVEYL